MRRLALGLILALAGCAGPAYYTDYDPALCAAMGGVTSPPLTEYRSPAGRFILVERWCRFGGC